MDGNPLFVYLFEFRFNENGFAEEHRAVFEGTFLDAAFYLAELLERGCYNITQRTIRPIREAC